GDHGAANHAAARKRHRAALRAVGARDQEFLIDVICYERPIPAETMKNRHVKVIRFARLRAALDLLAKHYGV
ncbi:MAG TPA: hypothetical protein DCO82_05300, partial [Alphaproteobacteria bacterium]|nr:hypothetical protein [Alphaproteobacteria bacterium]